VPVAVPSTPGAFIRRVNASRTDFTFDLWLLGPTGAFEYPNPAGSIVTPADSSAAITVGAYTWSNTSAVASYSSQEPTVDGRVKPDITGPSGFTARASSGTGNVSISGTSFSSPVVAGAAAVALQANPTFTPAQVQAWLEARATDKGAVGKDSVFGAGLLNLGSPARVAVSGTTVSESAGNAAVTISLLDQPSGSPVTVSYATSNGMAQAGSDYGSTSGTATITAGAMSTVVHVPIINDAVDELDETFTVTISNASGASIQTGTASVTITDDDPTPSLAVANLSVAESAGAAAVTITLSGASDREVRVGYSTSIGTATAGQDFAATSGTAVFAPGTLSKAISVPITNDALYETNETFSFAISQPVNAVIGGSATATVTITNDDPAPSLSVAPVTVEERAGSASVRIAQSAVSGRATSLQFATANGAALAGQDYTASSGTATIPAGATSTAITLQVIDDEIDEPDESFTVAFSNVQNATLGVQSVTVTIKNDDALPVITAPAIVVSEDAGTAVLRLVQSFAARWDVTVGFATSGETAQHLTDYLARNGTATIPAGATSTTVVIQLVNETLSEAPEYFTVSFYNPSRATLAPTAISVRVDIVDDDGEPAISVSGGTYSKSVGAAIAVISLSRAAGRDVAVQYRTINGTAVAGRDHTAVSGTITVRAGETSAVVTIPITDDAVYEFDEVFVVELLSPVGATLAPSGAQAEIVIADNDSVPGYSVTGETIIESDGEAVVRIVMQEPSEQPITFNYATLNNGAVAPGDYDGGAGSVTLPAGETSARIVVPIVDDSLHETDEDIDVAVTPTGADTATQSAAAASTGTARIVIHDDDPQPAISVLNLAVMESVGNALVTVALDAPSGLDVTFNYETVDGTAVAPLDYKATAGSGTIPAGATSTTVAILVRDDSRYEKEPENFSVRLTSVAGASVAPNAAGAVTIQENDPPPPPVPLASPFGLIVLLFGVALLAGVRMRFHAAGPLV